MKKILIFLVFLLIILVAAAVVGQRWLGKNLIVLLNEDTERAYDVSYETLDLRLLRGQFDLINASITPTGKDPHSKITGSIEKVQAKGIYWPELIISAKLNVSELIFESPHFELILAPSDTVKERPTKDVQQLFGDILSRGELHKFSLVGGSFTVRTPGEQSEEVAHIGKFSFEALDIETDSLQWKYPIPFKLGSFTSSVEDILFKIDDHSTFTCGGLEFNPQKNTLSLHDLSLKFNKDWVEVSEILGTQIDLIAMNMKSLQIRGIGANSQFVDDIDIRSEAIIIDSLVLLDHRDKNKPRPPDKEMPMFASMVGSIPIGLKVDTILIRNSFITYTELPPEKTNAGSIHFDNLYGSIYNVTTLEIFKQEYKQFEADLIGKLNGNGHLSVRLTVPYGRRGFRLKARMDSLDATVLNSTLVPMADVMANSGYVTKLELDMQAQPTFGENKMIMDYYDLSLNVLKEGKNRMKRRGIVSDIANFAIRTKNDPTTKNYIIADYRSERNIYRGPFNFMWQTVKEGFIQIIPTKTTKGLLGQGDKKKKTK